MGESVSQKPFGHRLVEALQKHGRRDVVTGRLNYAAIQELKSASRAQTVELFRGSSASIRQCIESNSPDEVAAYLVGFADGRESRESWEPMELVFLGLTLFS